MDSVKDRRRDEARARPEHTSRDYSSRATTEPHISSDNAVVEPATLPRDQPSVTNVSMSGERAHPDSYQSSHHLIRQCSQDRQHDLQGIGAQFETSLDDFRQTLSADLPPFLGLTSDCPYYSQLLRSDLQGEGTSALSQGKDAATYQSDDQCHVTKQGCWCRHNL
ncbi:uncharacterized protein EAE97_006257 [Botrytis byssoidea]|uniref:Uncharacterized protein n=1 Tax=Botrytis byssoidea TaxID=139641 RepID=A0A9P5M2N8_9HELO|nr:uncharacterized protein EAE97_006257 [Botrytis byssoidea]KAF7942803.1 hypothetical protein EAE97_006257 [Botrytis byssoidea]